MAWATLQVTLTASTVRQLERVLPAAARGQTAKLHPQLAGVHFTGRRVAAADGYRLAVATVDQNLPGLLLAAGQLAPAVRAARRSGDGQLELNGEPTAAALQVTGAGDTWSVDLLHDTYPDVEVLLGCLHTEGIIEADTAALRKALGALKRALTGSNGRCVPLVLQPTADLLVLAARGGQTRWHVELPARCTTIQPVGLHPGYLLDALAAVTATTARIHVGGGCRALHLHDQGLIHAVKPYSPHAIQAQETAA